MKFRFATNFATLILLCICFGIIIGINYGQASASDKIKGSQTVLTIP